MEDYYKVIGTSIQAIKHKRLISTEEEIDNFIKEKYEYMIRRINNKREIFKESEEFGQQIEQIMNAYQHIKTQNLRDLYERKIEEEEQGKKSSKTRKKTIYDVLGINKESMNFREDEENDKIIKQRRDIIVAELLKDLEKLYKKLEVTQDFKEKEKIKTKIGIIKQNLEIIEKNYEKIKTKESREEYDAQLQDKFRKEKNKEKYSHALECNMSLIATRPDSVYKSLEDKIVIKKEKNSDDDTSTQELCYINGKNQEIKIKQIATILFRNWMGMNSNIDEFEIKRLIDGQERVDIVYTNLNIAELSIDKKTGQPINPSYYDCVMNQLLSEDILDISKYNGGYIGMVAQDRDGSYYMTIEEKKLSSGEQEKLTAIMILEKKREKALNEKKGEEI